MPLLAPNFGDAIETTCLLSYHFWHSLNSVFIISSVLCSVVALVAILPPTIVSVTHSSVKLSHGRPKDAIWSKGVVYRIKYRKVRSFFWKSTRETKRLRQTVTGLEANSRYEFKLVARFQEQSSAVESRSVTAKTKESKGALLNFSWMSRIYRSHSLPFHTLAQKTHFWLHLLSVVIWLSLQNVDLSPSVCISDVTRKAKTGSHGHRSLYWHRSLYSYHLVLFYFTKYYFVGPCIHHIQSSFSVV